MDIRFNILIVDDSIQSKDDPAYKNIKGIVEGMNMLPSIELSDGSNYKKVVNSRDFDLYLIDFSLVDDIEGQDVIKEIRDTNKNLTDILLYSTTNENLYGKISEYNLDGIYICGRKDLVQKTERILKKIEKRMQNPTVLRGMVLHNCSDFENKLKRFLINQYCKADDAQKQLIEVHLKNTLHESDLKYKEAIAAFENGEFVVNLLSDQNYYYDMFKKIKLLDYFRKKRLIQGISIKNIRLLHRINDLRNLLGHSILSIDSGNMILEHIDGTIEKYDQAKCDKIRSDIIEVVKVFDILKC